MKRIGLFIAAFTCLALVGVFSDQPSGSGIEVLEREIAKLREDIQREHEWTAGKIDQLIDIIEGVHSISKSPNYPLPVTHVDLPANRIFIEEQTPLNGNAITLIVNHIKRESNASERVIRELIVTYDTEARREGINVYLAIAQMLHTTDYLNNQGIRDTTYNYAGFNVDGTQVRSWESGTRGRFSSRTLGVRAHIQHLKFYSNGRLNNPSNRVDPRWDKVSAPGRINSLRELAATWAPYNPRYGDNIKNIYNYLKFAVSRLDA
jgi:hypothetical protein